MRLAIPFALVLAATTASRQGCGNGTRPPTYDACADKACGEACTACPPDDPGCFETAVVKACDPFHRCVPKVDGLCDAAQAACAGKPCGDECVIDPPCRSATPPCMVPSVVGHCDPSGTCVPGIPTPDFCPPVTSCDGQACGVVCEMACPAGVACDPAKGWCDGAGQCRSVAPPCPAPPPDPCRGKACGASCDPCGGMCMHPYASACDASGACVPVPVTCGP